MRMNYSWDYTADGEQSELWISGRCRIATMPHSVMATLFVIFCFNPESEMLIPSRKSLMKVEK